MDLFVNDIYYHVFDTDARVIVAYGGRDSGKSYFFGDQYTPISMLQDEYFRGVCIRKTYNSLKDSVYREILDGIDEMGMSQAFTSIKSPLEIACNESKLLFRGLDKPVNIKSLKGINYIWVEEAETLTEREYNDLLILLRGDGYQRLVLTYNPIDDEQFTKEMFVDCKKDKVLETFEDGTPKVWELIKSVEVDGKAISYKVLVLNTTYQDNMFISPMRKAIIEGLKDTDPYLYEIYAKGKYARREGMILNNYKVIDMSELEFVNYDKRGYAQDFGFNHANCILSVAKYENDLYVFDEIYEHEKDTSEIIEIADRKGLDKRLLMSCDSASPGPIKTWKKSGYSAVGVKKYQGSVKDQIDWLKSFDNIYISDTCTNTIKEIKQWTWKQNKNGKFIDTPVDIFDDAMACLRYSKDLFSKSNIGVATVRGL